MAERRMAHALKQNGYDIGHCWYYKLKGKRPRLRDFFLEVDRWIADARKPLDGDLVKAVDLPINKRQDALLALRDKHRASLRVNVSIWVPYIRMYQGYVRTGIECELPLFNCLFTGLSLKCCHIMWDFYHLRLIEDSLAEQPDLFM